LCAALFFCAGNLWRWKSIKELRINEEIRASEVRLVEDGEDSIVLPLRDALTHAVEKGLDLVEISPNAKPPVCRVMDYGKFRFEQLKREKEAKEAAKSEQLKSLIERMRVVLGTQVSLIGNDKKGRIYIDYHSPEALLRIEEVLGIEEIPDEQLSIFPKDDEE